MDENQRTLAVEAVGLRKSFGTVRAVDGVDLTVRAGEIVAFLGPNGAGKTTTIDMLLGLSDPDGGTVRVFGETPRGHLRARRPSGGAVLGRSAAAAALRDGPAQRPGPARARRAHDGHGCRGAPRLLERDPRRCGPRSHGALRDALPRRGRRIRRPHRADEPGRIVADGTTAEIKNLVAGRIVRATLPGADPVALGALPGATEVECAGDRVTIHTKDSDAIARHLLTQTAARDVEITAQNLESVFLALTSEGVSA